MQFVNENEVEREVSRFFKPLTDDGFYGDIAIEFPVISDMSVIGNMLMLSSIKERQGYARFKLDSSVPQGFVVYTAPETIDSFEEDEGVWKELFYILQWSQCNMEGLTVKISKSLIDNSLEGLADFLSQHCPFVKMKSTLSCVDFIFSGYLSLSRFRALTDLVISVSLNARRLQGSKKADPAQWLLGMSRKSIENLQSLLDFEAL